MNYQGNEYSKTYYYVHTGHRIGLDRFRRASAILKALDADITLLSSDYRIAQIAYKYGIEKAVGVDVVRNIPQIAKNGDKLILDSDEANPIMIEDMKQYFSTFIHLTNDTIAVDEQFLNAKNTKNVKLTYFFGDDDYEKDLEKNIDFIADLKPHLQLGFYYFLDYEDVLREKFEHCYDFEEYADMILETEILITCSPQAVLDSLASGGKPIYVQREDYIQDMDELFKELNIPIILNYNKSDLNMIIKSIFKRKYGDLTHKSKIIKKNLKEELNLN